MPGHSYRADEYESIIREVIGRASVGADLVANVVGLTREQEPDRLALGRIGRERDAAMARYLRDRDPRALESTMAALDGVERDARAGAGAAAMPAADIVDYLHDLPTRWDAAPASRRGLAESLFARIDVLGLRQMRIEPTYAAIRAGLAEAFASTSAGYGRGERTCPDKPGALAGG